MYYIYKIQNIVNHKVYIGLTNNIQRRKNRHFSDLRNNRHDNKFLQQEYNIYGLTKFTFSIEFQGEVSYEEISKKEEYFIEYYDSYKNGYNQNRGGNFGPSNGGTHLTQKDIFYICSALEFCSRPGGVLSKIFNVSLTTISRIKYKINHNEDITLYQKKSLSERRSIYQTFCKEYNFYKEKINQTIIKTKRKMLKEQVFLILANFEYKILKQKDLMKKVNIKSRNTLLCIKNNLSYKDYKLEYDNLTSQQKKTLVSLLSN